MFAAASCQVKESAEVTYEKAKEVDQEHKVVEKVKSVPYACLRLCPSDVVNFSVRALHGLRASRRDTSNDRKLTRAKY